MLRTNFGNFDADAPHAPRGCMAQARNVAEVLRVKLES
jgi:glycogen debranching enzyme